MTGCRWEGPHVADRAMRRTRPDGNMPSLPENGRDMSKKIYSNDSFELTSSAFQEGDKLAEIKGDTLVTADGETIDTTVDAGFPQLSSDCAMLDVDAGTHEVEIQLK